MPRLLIILMLGLGISLLGCERSPQHPEWLEVYASGEELPSDDYITKRIGREDLGEAWPFTTEKAIVVCIPVTTDSAYYAIVGQQPFSITHAAARLAMIKKIKFDVRGKKQLAPVPLDTESEPSQRLLVSGKNISAFSSEALKVC